MPKFLKRTLLPASTTSLASFNVASGSNPISPSTGDSWYNGSQLPFYDGTKSHDLIGQLFESTGTYIPAPGVTEVFLTGCAGGGGGGNGDAIVRVQSFKNGSSTAAATLVVTCAAPTNGNTLVMAIDTGGQAISSISQTGATWVQAVTINGNPPRQDIWYASNVSGAGTSITINFATNAASAAVGAEYSGLLTSSALDKTASNSGNSSSLDSGTTATTTQAVELWIGSLGQNSNGSSQTLSSPTNGFTIVDQTSNTSQTCGLLEKIVSSTGTSHTGATSTVSNFWAGATATFKGAAIAGAGGGGSGASSQRFRIPVTAGTSYTVTPGAGGAAAANGGDTTFGSLFTLQGGRGGASASAGVFGAGGDGGKVTLGSGFSGASGGAGSQAATGGGNGGGYNFFPSGASTDGASGSTLGFSSSGGQGGASISDGGGGASSLFGVGGNGGHGAAAAGSNATGYGSGGGGGAGGGGGGAGGTGSAGFLMVETS